jgi:hypothetical protein
MGRRWIAAACASIAVMAFGWRAAERTRQSAAPPRIAAEAQPPLDAAPRAPEPRAQPVAPPREDGLGQGSHPHPITDDHRRLFRDADLLHGAQDALAAGDALRARVLLAQHAKEYPQADPDREGLFIVADCVAQPSPEIRQRARRFYDERTASSVRKRLRRACLEGRP